MSQINTEEAEDVLYGDALVARQEISKHRWYTRELIVFRKEDALQGFYYYNPATEEQEDQDRFESDPVEVFPVEACEVVTTIYERKEA